MSHAAATSYVDPAPADTSSLASRYADLSAERARTWSPEALARHVDQRRVLVEGHDPAAHPQPGTRLAPFFLQDAEGNSRSSVDLLAEGPIVLAFFRFGGCPACNIALDYYNTALWPELDRRGITFLAVSAQTPVDRTPTQRHDLRFETYGDPGYALSRQLGVTFLPDDQPAVAPGTPWIGATLGTDSYEINQPAIVVIEPDHTLRALIVSPDWLDRPEAETVLGLVT